MKYSLNQLYQVIGLSKQAVSQYLLRQDKFEQYLSDLLIEVDELRAETAEARGLEAPSV